MLMKKDFWLVINKLGLEDHEVDLAALIWEKCEKAMQGKTNQTPTLLTGKAPRIQSTKTFVLKPAISDETALTREELQFLKEILRVELHNGNDYKGYLKSQVADLWNLADPSHAAGRIYFSKLNVCKDKLRVQTTYNTKLSKIQTKIKRKLGK